VAVTSTVAIAAFVVTLFAVRGVEGAAEPVTAPSPTPADRSTPGFREAMIQVWSEDRARRFAIFVFVSMLAYSAQDLILEPFAGAVFGLTPGESTKLAGVQNAGVLVGMIVLAVLGSRAWGRRFGSLQAWTVRGCLASASALLALALGGFLAPDWPLHLTVFLLGLSNGIFAVAAIGSMMGLVAAGRERREGVRMGLWGAAQAVAFGLGGFLGTAAIDLTRSLMASPVPAYALVFAGEALMFLVSAGLAVWVTRPTGSESTETRFSTDAEPLTDTRAP
jgi:BCD family chlorophyll transporter-like MFS transporter